MLLPLSNVKVKLMLNYSTVNISFKTCIEIELANIYLQYTQSELHVHKHDSRLHFNMAIFRVGDVLFLHTTIHYNVPPMFYNIAFKISPDS